MKKNKVLLVSLLALSIGVTVSCNNNTTNSSSNSQSIVSSSETKPSSESTPNTSTISIESSASSVSSSESISVDTRTEIEAPVMDKDSYNSVYWLPVDGAKGYIVSVNDVAGQLTQETSFSIDGLGYGTFKISVVAVAENEQTNKNSASSNEITLEVIDPSEYAQKLSIDVTSNSKMYVGDKYTLEASVKSNSTSDISYIDKTLEYSISETETKVSIDEDGKIVGLEAGEAVITVSMKNHPSVTRTFTLIVEAKPVITLSLETYDKTNLDNNKATFSTTKAGTLYVVASDTKIESAEGLLASEDKISVEVASNTNEVNLNLGSLKGISQDLYAVLVVKEDNKVIGNSAVISLTVSMNPTVTQVANKSELVAALTTNAEYIKLTQDIDLEGAWTQIDYFDGILDGNGHKISNATLTGKGTGLFNKLGNKTVIKNITFDGIKNEGFTGAENAIIAHTVADEAKVTFENIAVINASTNSKEVGSSRSTNGCLIAVYKNVADTKLNIIVKNAYFQYENIVSRSTATYNMGTIFGTLVSSSPNQLVMENVVIDAKFSGNYGNVGGIVGQSSSSSGSNAYTLTNVVVRVEALPGTAAATDCKIDLGLTGTCQENASYLFISNTIGATLTENVIKTNANVTTEAFAAINSEIISFNNETKEISITVNGHTYKISEIVLEQLAAPSLSIEGKKVTWTAIEKAAGYIVKVDGVELDAQTTTSYDFSALAVGDHEIMVMTVGDNFKTTSSGYSVAITATVEPIVLPRVDAPEISISEGSVTWTAVTNAVGYDVYVNNELVGSNITTTSYSLASIENYGEFVIEVIAKGDNTSYIDSNKSNESVYVNALEVSTMETFKEAITNGVGYIKITADIDMTGYLAPNVVYSGVIDGTNHTLTGMNFKKNSSSSGGCGLVYKAGKVTIKNLVIQDGVIQAEAKNMAFVISITDTDSEIVIENVALINCVATTKSAGASCSTQGAVIGEATNCTKITFKNVYVDYTHNVTRTDKAQSNIGGLIGACAVTTTKLNLENVYIKFNVTGWYSNAGAIIGNKACTVDMKDVVIVASQTPYVVEEVQKSANFKADFGNASSGLVVTQDNLVIVSEEGIKGSYGDGFAVVSPSNVTVTTFANFINESKSFITSGVSGIAVNVASKTIIIVEKGE